MSTYLERIRCWSTQSSNVPSMPDIQETIHIRELLTCEVQAKYNWSTHFSLGCRAGFSLEMIAAQTINKPVEIPQISGTVAW